MCMPQELGTVEPQVVVPVARSEERRRHHRVVLVRHVHRGKSVRRAVIVGVDGRDFSRRAGPTWSGGIEIPDRWQFAAVEHAHLARRHVTHLEPSLVQIDDDPAPPLVIAARAPGEGLSSPALDFVTSTVVMRTPSGRGSGAAM